MRAMNIVLATALGACLEVSKVWPRLRGEVFAEGEVLEQLATCLPTAHCAPPSHPLPPAALPAAAIAEP